MFRYQRRWAAGLCVAVNLALIGIPAAPVGAEVFNCGTKQSTTTFFDGFDQESNSSPEMEGASAVIKTQHGAVCDTDTGQRTSRTAGANNFTNAWTMIATNFFASKGGWAQSGFERDYNDAGIYFFAQNYDGGTNLQTLYSAGTVAAGTLHTYKQEWIGTCGCIKSYVDSTEYIHTTFNPFVAWVRPFSPQFLGEARYLASDIAGNAASRTSYTSMKGQRYTDNVWQAYPCGLSGVNDGSSVRADGLRWKRAASSCTAFDIYTDI